MDNQFCSCKLSADQKNAFKFLDPSIYHIPFEKITFEKLDIPLVLAVTPFPRDSKSIPLVSEDNNIIARCNHCDAIITKNSKKILKLRRKKVWKCPYCAQKNKPNDLMIDDVQIHNSVFDVHYSSNGSPCFNQCSNLVIIENSREMIESGVFQNVIYALKNTFGKKQNGMISVFLFNSHISVPFIPKNKKYISMSTICDNELPPINTSFFSLDNESDLFVKYLDSISRLSTDPTNENLPMLKIIDVVEAVNPLCAKFKLPVTIITYDAIVGSAQEYRNFALNNITNTTSYKFFCLNPINQYNIPKNDYSPISELSLIINSKKHIYSKSQFNAIPQDLINELLEPVLFDITISSYLQKSMLEIDDIKGPGIRQRENDLYIPCAYLDDTFYVFVNYSSMLIFGDRPQIQMQVKYLDCLRAKFLRIMAINLYPVGNLKQVINSCNIDLIISSIFIESICKAKECNPSKEMECVLNEFNDISNKFNSNSYIQSLLQDIDYKRIAIKRLKNALTIGRNYLKPDNFSFLVGKHFIDIARFFVPVGYEFQSFTNIIPRPKLLNELKHSNDHLFIITGKDSAVFIVNQHEPNGIIDDQISYQEIINNSYSLLQKDDFPNSKFINEDFTSANFINFHTSKNNAYSLSNDESIHTPFSLQNYKTIEILPSSSNYSDSHVYNHIMNCMQF